MHPLDRDSVAALLRISSPRRIPSNARLRARMGAWVTMAVTVTGIGSGWRGDQILSASDLTDRRQLEDRRAAGQKTEIIAACNRHAHDFGNILMVVRSYDDVMVLTHHGRRSRHSYVDANPGGVTVGDSRASCSSFSASRCRNEAGRYLNASVDQSVELLRRVVGSASARDAAGARGAVRDRRPDADIEKVNPEPDAQCARCMPMVAASSSAPCRRHGIRCRLESRPHPNQFGIFRDG